MDDMEEVEAREDTVKIPSYMPMMRNIFREDILKSHKINCLYNWRDGGPFRQ